MPSKKNKQRKYTSKLRKKQIKNIKQKTRKQKTRKYRGGVDELDEIPKFTIRQKPTTSQQRFNLLDFLFNVKPDTCLTDPIPIGDENVYMYFTKENEEQMLFNIFKFTQKPNGIQYPNFFRKLYDLIFTKFEKYDSHDFYITTNNEGNIDLYSKIKYEDEQFNNYFYPYLLYVLANSKIELEEGVIINIEMFHPDAHSDYTSGIHKDDSHRSCLTYIDSPISTELAFHLENLGIDWLKCSPLFRFDTSNYLYTLVFNDALMYHTIPIWEEEGKQTEKTNFFEEGYKMTRRADLLEFEKSGTIEGTFQKPMSREMISKPEKRRVLSSFISIVEEIPSGLVKKSFPMAVLQDYKIIQEEEKIELSQQSVRTIIESPTLGQMKMRGGERRKSYRHN
jgi:hypothetical protein